MQFAMACCGRVRKGDRLTICSYHGLILPALPHEHALGYAAHDAAYGESVTVLVSPDFAQHGLPPE